MLYPSSSYIDQVSLDNGYPYIKALLDIGDNVDHESVGFTMFSSNTHAVRLVIWFLRRIESLEKRGKLLLTCFTESNGLSIVEHILLSDENRRNKSEGDIVLADNEFNELKTVFVNKLNNMAVKSPDELMKHSHLVSFLYRWKQWADEDEVISWIHQQIQSSEGCVNLLKAFVSKSSSQGMGDYVAKITSNIRLENIGDFVSVDEINDKISDLDPASLDNKGREAIEAFKNAFDRREKGIVDNW